MKKNFLTISFITLFFNILMAQNQYYDALRLEKYLVDDGQGKLVFNANVDKIKEWAEILAMYEPDLGGHREDPGGAPEMGQGL